MFLFKGKPGTKKNETKTEGRVNWGMAPPGDTSCLQTPNPTLLQWSKVLVERNQVWQFLGRFHQHLTNTEAEAWSPSPD